MSPGAKMMCEYCGKHADFPTTTHTGEHYHQQCLARSILDLDLDEEVAPRTQLLEGQAGARVREAYRNLVYALEAFVISRREV